MKYNQLINLLGPKTKKKFNINGKVLYKKIFKNYIQETVSYNVEKNERVNSLLLIPKELKGKTPLIICHHQHAGKYNNAKSEIVGLKGNKNLAYAKELSQKGFITFAPDAISFEERNKAKKNWWGSEYYELASRIVQGKTLLEKTLSDISFAINYLETRDEIDKSKIGFIGHSYGGRMVVLLPAYDKRIKASVSNCYCKNIKDSLNFNAKTRIPMELVVPNILKYGDFQDIVKLVHPCHLFISGVKNDKWSKDAIKIYKFAKPFFKKSELRLKMWSGKHEFSKKMRYLAYKFLEEKLK
tara:strand:+ start:1087 stop:1980 length:894 start_codon:yes stop_codon:yes gene_type:complete